MHNIQCVCAVTITINLHMQWSYGVTCWEIFSLGRIPYPGVDNVDVIDFLKSGKRLEQPELCPSKM